ncbi:MAG: DUF3857 and transglutaminase domain-containing protein [Opitutaceae bacterium]|jgi:hypothetical protein
MSSSAPTPPAITDTASLSKISYAPVPTWVLPVSFDPAHPRKEGLPLTYLLTEEQQHAEERCHYSRLVARLETMQAVQQLSQWRTSFDPLTQSVILHHLRVHRDGTVFDYAQPEHVRILQREESLDAFILHGRITVLVVFNDVRPGDIIETSHSIVHTPRLLPHRHSAFHTLLDAFPVAKYNIALTFASSRAMRWKSSAPEQKPDEATVDGLTCWTWRGENRPAVTPEPNVPGWVLPGFWVQVSDVTDWAEVSAATASAWAENENEDQAPLTACLAEIKARSTDPVARIEQLLRFVQDDFRYLSVNLELGGYIPSSPASVLNRRYGDCKDLSRLLACLLQKLGIKARPVFVNTRLGKSLQTLLPGANLFNHAIVEFTLDGETRWIDATLKRQGGGPLGRWIPRFDFGLPLSIPGETLSPQPAPERKPDRYEIHETLLLDTAGNPSLLKVATNATGRHAESFRLQMEDEGIVNYGKSRAQIQAARYVNAVPSIEPCFEDDREINEWRMVEIYKVFGFTTHNSAARTRSFVMPPNLAVTALPVPGKEKRTFDFALPADIHLEHTMEVRSRTFTQLPVTVKVFKQPGISLKVELKHPAGRWSQRAVLVTAIDAIKPQDLDPYRKLIESVYSTAAWALTVKNGIARQRRGIDFANLPPSSQKPEPIHPAPIRPVPTPITLPAKPEPSPAAARPDGSTSHYDKGRSHRHRRRKRSWPISIVLAALGVLIAAGGVGVYLFFHP